MFKDHFSGHSQLYSRYRPDYPDALFRFLAKQSPATDLAWDCATGSGQAALGLAEHFSRIIATDASAAQVEQAMPHPRVEYRVAPAEHTPITDASVDLITVAQALHWFDLDGFYAEARRVLKPGGVLAVWSYKLPHCNPAINAIIDHLYSDIVSPFWPPERAYIDNDLRELPFPFTEEPTPNIEMQTHWDLEQLLGYLRTWSAVQHYQQAHGLDPVSLIETRLGQHWGESGQTRTIHWPMVIRWGCKP